MCKRVHTHAPAPPGDDDLPPFWSVLLNITDEKRLSDPPPSLVFTYYVIHAFLPSLCRRCTRVFSACRASYHDCLALHQVRGCFLTALAYKASIKLVTLLSACAWWPVPRS